MNKGERIVTEKMKPEFKALWLEALRSGAYSQGTGMLRNSQDTPAAPEYCCLGVLCDVVALQGHGEWDFGTFRLDENWESTVLPDSVMELVGLKSDNPNVKVSDSETDWNDYVSLAELNDSGSSFEQIADIIEQQL
jgi:hypothetical protein